MIDRKFFYRVIGALALGAYLSLVIAQSSTRFKRIVEQELQKQFARSLSCSFQGSITRMSILGLSMDLKDVQVAPLNFSENWSWKAKKCSFTLSWLSFLLTRKFALQTLVEDYQADSGFDNGFLQILNHGYKLACGLDLPVPLALRGVTFKNAKMNFFDETVGLRGYIVWNGQSGRAGSFFKSRFYLSDGQICLNDIPFVTNITGTNSGQLQAGSSPLAYTINNDFQFILPQLKEQQQQCFMEATWQHTGGACVVHNQDYSFHVDSLRTLKYKKQLLCQGNITAPLYYLGSLAGGTFLQEQLQGTCDISFFGNPFKELSGKIVFKNPFYKGYGVDNVGLSFLMGNYKAHGAVTIAKQGGTFSGAWKADLKEKTMSTDLVNHTLWPIHKMNFWNIPAHQGKISCSLDSTKKVQCDYHVIAQNSKTENKVESKGTVTFTPYGKLYALGTLGKNKYTAKMQLFPYFIPQFISYKDENENHLLQVYSQPLHKKDIEATIAYDFIRSVLQELFDYDVAGEGTIHIKGMVDAQGAHGKVYTKDATIRLPEMYNFLSDFSSEFTIQYNPLRITVSNTKAQLHKGSVTCLQAQIWYNTLYELDFLHIPLQASHCFLNWQSDLFAIASGALVLEKRKTSPYKLTGFALIEKGQLKENPLSGKGQKELTQFILPSTLLGAQDLVIDVGLITHDPLYIKTPQLKTRVILTIDLSNTLRALHVSGKLKLLGGSLQFPYRPLHITHAHVSFLPHQPYDPLIELVAQGSIKKYSITLSVSGTVKDPHIMLDSSPSLTEEQILALLFTGTVEESLNLMVPTFVMRNIETLLFGPAGNVETGNSSWLEPLRRIRIVPSFADQTGRGGFRGALEIDVSEQLHAKLQKNFSLPEDTRIEVEYLFSDDISLKAIKDERSDVGAEIEMRFKF